MQQHMEIQKVGIKFNTHSTIELNDPREDVPKVAPLFAPNKREKRKIRRWLIHRIINAGPQIGDAEIADIAGKENTP